MIKFVNGDNDKQFISIALNDTEEVNVDELVNKIKADYPGIKALHVLFDESEILIPLINDCNYGFSLKQLREYLKPLAAATVSHFAVDTEELTQRYNG